MGSVFASETVEKHALAQVFNVQYVGSLQLVAQVVAYVVVHPRGDLLIFKVGHSDVGVEYQKLSLGVDHSVHRELQSQFLDHDVTVLHHASQTLNEVYFGLVLLVEDKLSVLAVKRAQADQPHVLDGFDVLRVVRIVKSGQLFLSEQHRVGGVEFPHFEI